MPDEPLTVHKFTVKKKPEYVEEVTGRIEVWPNGIDIYFDGYETFNEIDGAPIWIEHWQGELRAVIWSDVDREDPTHEISLEGAKKKGE